LIPQFRRHQRAGPASISRRPADPAPPRDALVGVPWVQRRGHRSRPVWQSRPAHSAPATSRPFHPTDGPPAVRQGLTPIGCNGVMLEHTFSSRTAFPMPLVPSCWATAITARLKTRRAATPFIHSDCGPERHPGPPRSMHDLAAEIVFHVVGKLMLRQLPSWRTQPAWPTCHTSNRTISHCRL
jgi:hypothetical protein